MMEISVLIDGSVTVPISEEWLRGVAERVLTEENITAPVELGLLITSDDQLKRLNWSFRSLDEPTDVLAFATMEIKPGETTEFMLPPDGMKHLGEVILSYPQAVRQAAEHQHSVEREVALLIVHGVLHLLGYDHDEPEREARMQAREKAILATIEEP